MIHVSDHALLRFLERLAGLDTDELRLKLGKSLERARRAADQLGADEYTIKAGGIVYVIKDNTLVTLFEPKEAAR